MIPIVLTIPNDSDRAFVEKLYLRYRKKIYASAFRILNQREDAEDCVHDVIQTVIRHVGTFRAASPEGAVRLLAVCTRNAAINIYRKNKKRQDNENPLPFDTAHEGELLAAGSTVYQSEDPAAIVVDKESRRRLAQIIAEMDETYRDVLILRIQHKMSNREIADMLKLSANTVAVRLHRAKKILLEEREAELDEIRKTGAR